MWNQDDKPAGTRRMPPLGKGSATESTRVKNHPLDETSRDRDEVVRRMPPLGKGSALPPTRVKNHPIDEPSS